MKSVTITALSLKGDFALRKHLEECNKVGIVHRISFKRLGYRQTKVSDNPFTLLIEVTNPYFQSVLRKEAFCDEIDRALLINGAGKEDYKIEVKE